MSGKLEKPWEIAITPRKFRCFRFISSQSCNKAAYSMKIIPVGYINVMLLQKLQYIGIGV